MLTVTCPVLASAAREAGSCHNPVPESKPLLPSATLVHTIAKRSFKILNCLYIVICHRCNWKISLNFPTCLITRPKDENINTKFINHFN